MKKQRWWIIGGVLLVVAAWFAIGAYRAREAERAREAAAREAAAKEAEQAKQDAQLRSKIFALYASIERDDAVVDSLDANPSPARAHAVYVSLARNFAEIIKLADGFHGPIDEETRARVGSARGRLPALRFILGEMTDPVERAPFEAYFRALATPE
jgi:hypothetical protein